RDAAGWTGGDPAHRRAPDALLPAPDVCRRVRGQALRHRRQARLPQGNGRVRARPARPGGRLSRLPEVPEAVAGASGRRRPSPHGPRGWRGGARGAFSRAAAGVVEEGPPRPAPPTVAAVTLT